MNVTLPNGTTIKNIPDGTSKAEVAEKAIKAGLATPADFGMSNDDGLWARRFHDTNQQFADAFSDIGRGILHGGAKSADNLANLYQSANAELNKLVGAGDGTYQPTHLIDHTSAPRTIEGKAGEVLPEMALMFSGWGAGEGLASAGLSLLPEAATAGRAANLAAKALEAGGGSLGAQSLSGDKPTAGQTAGDVALSLAIPAIIRAPAAAMKSVKSLIGKPDQAIVDAAKKLGVTPSVSTATGNKTAFKVEEMLSNVPGAAGVIQGAKEAEFKQIDKFIDDLSESHGATGDTTATGEAVLKGLQKFAADFSQKSEKLYDQLWAAFPRGTRIETDHFRDALESISGRYRDDPEIAALLSDQKVESLLKAVSEKPMDEEKADLIFQVTGLQPPKATKPADLTLDTVKALRTRIGASLDKPELLSRNLEDADRERLYSALTKDIEAAAEQAGGKAKSAWSRANRYWRSGRERIDNFLNPLFRRNTADSVYQALFGTEGKKLTPLTPQRAAVYMKSLPENERNIIRGEIIRRLGEPSAANRTKEGEGFSPDRFLTDWNNLPEASKKALFSDGDTRANLDALATYSEALRDLGRTRNFSNTANHGVLYGLISGAIGGVITGHPLPVLMIAPVVGGAKISAKLMNSPKFIEWLATASKGGDESEIGRNIARLVAVYFMNPPLQDDISKFADHAGGTD